MSLERAKQYLAQKGLESRVMEFKASSATVELAAAALGCSPARIAKTLSFAGKTGPVLIVTAGDAKIENHKYKETFGCKAKMLRPEEAERLIGHAVGGVCPFGVPEDVEVYLDQSLKRFDVVYPACGSSNSAVRLTVSELEEASGSREWVDVCQGWQDDTERGAG